MNDFIDPGGAQAPPALAPGVAVWASMEIAVRFAHDLSVFTLAGSGNIEVVEGRYWYFEGCCFIEIPSLQNRALFPFEPNTQAIFSTLYPVLQRSFSGRSAVTLRYLAECPYERGHPNWGPWLKRGLEIKHERQIQEQQQKLLGKMQDLHDERERLADEERLRQSELRSVKEKQIKEKRAAERGQALLGLAERLNVDVDHLGTYFSGLPLPVDAVSFLSDDDDYRTMLVLAATDAGISLKGLAAFLDVTSTRVAQIKNKANSKIRRRKEAAERRAAIQTQKQVGTDPQVANVCRALAGMDS